MTGREEHFSPGLPGHGPGHGLDLSPSSLITAAYIQLRKNSCLGYKNYSHSSGDKEEPLYLDRYVLQLFSFLLPEKSISGCTPQRDLMWTGESGWILLPLQPSANCHRLPLEK